MRAYAKKIDNKREAIYLDDELIRTAPIGKWEYVIHLKFWPFYLDGGKECESFGVSRNINSAEKWAPFPMSKTLGPKEDNYDEYKEKYKDILRTRRCRYTGQTLISIPIDHKRWIYKIHRD